jgi:hypothetical protein
MILLPEEIIQEILSYNPDFHPNLMKCHEELLIDRPCYYKRVHAGFKPGICDSPTWHNFAERNNTINVQFQTPMGQRYSFPLKLHAIEITPERERTDGYWHSRDMNLYYGWSKMTDLDFWNTITKANLFCDTFSPGYY